MRLWRKGNARSPLQKATAADAKMQTRIALSMTLIISSMVAGLIILAAHTQVPQIARAAGAVIPKGSYSKIESVEGGIVYSVLVSDGDLVQDGQVLLDLRNPSLVQEHARLTDSLEFATERYANVLATASGLETPENEHDAVLTDVRSRSLSQAAARLELFFNGQAIQKTAIAQKEKTKATLEASLSQALESAENQRASLASRQDLFSRGLTTQNEVQAAQSRFDSASTRASDTQVRLVEAEEGLVLAMAERESQRLEHIEEVLEQRAELESELQSLRSDVDIVEERLARQRIRSNASGRVQFSSATTIGEYIEPGQIVFELLPAEEVLVVEVKVSNTDYGYIELGQQVSVSFDNFDVRRYGKVEGTVTSMSPVPLIDEMTGETYFRTNVSLSQPYIGDGEFRRPVLAGFTGVAEMQTGQSPLLSYLLRPIERTLSAAFTER